MQAYGAGTRQACACAHGRSLRLVPFTAGGQLRTRSSSSPDGPGPVAAERKLPPRPPAQRPPMPGRPPVMLGPDGQPLEVVPVEKTSGDAWAGVARVDRGDDGSAAGDAGLLAAGDALAILAFAIIGRINHGEIVDVETLLTALPFWIGWFSAGAALGAYGKEARHQGVPAAAATAAKVWAVAIPAGLVLRGLLRGYAPPVPFIIVSLVANAALLVGWRSALAATTKQEAPLSPSAQVAQRKDKQGNPFEFLELLMSLTKRW